MTPANSTFHCFPNLPKELRLSIWRFALHQLRLITFGDATNDFHKWDKRHHNDDDLYFTSSSVPPPLLHTCSESRLEGLQYYTRAFDTGLKPRYIYVNFDADTIVMPEYDLDDVAIKDKRAMRSLLLTTEYWEYLIDDDFMGNLSRLSGLRDFVAVGMGWDGVRPAVEFEAVCRGLFKDLFQDREGWSAPNVHFVREDHLEDVLRERLRSMNTIAK